MHPSAWVGSAVEVIIKPSPEVVNVHVISLVGDDMVFPVKITLDGMTEETGRVEVGVVGK